MNPLRKQFPTGGSYPARGNAGRHLVRGLLAALLLFLGACSATTFLYNRLHILVPWYLGTYIDLDREQKDYLDRQLQPFLAWHRNEELASYVAIIADVEADLDQELDAAKVAAISARLEAAWFRLEARALEWMLDLGARLSDEQMAEFIDTLREKLREEEAEYLSRGDEEYRRDSYDGLKDSLQDYLGRLDASQREVLEQASAELIRSDGVWLAERSVWVVRLDGLLQRQTGWQEGIREALALRDQTVSREYVDTYAHNMAVIHRAVATVVNSRSARQDRRLRRELADLREDLQLLIEQGERRAAGEAA